MEQTQVFISYSHKDQKALKQFQRFTQPLERDGYIKFWVDTGLQGGDDWHAEIMQAMDVATTAVLFISQDFLASDFIWKQELPRILARAHAKELSVLPVFLSPCLVNDLEIPFVDHNGSERKDKLNRFQGYGSPQKPLSELSWSDRERIYTKLAQDIKGHFSQIKTSEPPFTPKPATASTETRKYELTVHLQRRGEQLGMDYYLPGTDIIASHTHPWNQLITPLESSNPSGAQLFQALFGPETAQWQSISRILFQQQTAPTPIRAGVRLRICTEEPLLLGLPWRLTSWNDHPLVDNNWEFTTSHQEDPSTDVTTTAPSNVLIIALQSEVKGITSDPAHSQAFIDTLCKVWPSKNSNEPEYVRVVRSKQALQNALQVMAPHLVYVYGQLDGKEALNLVELARLLHAQQAQPAVIYLNVTGLTNSGSIPGRWLNTPLLIWWRSNHNSTEANSLAITWLNRWLSTGEDPITALHKVDKRNKEKETAALAVHSAYRHWKTHVPYRTALRERLPHLALNREHQKALVRKQLAELARSDSRRVMALAAYAAPGNLLCSLHEQLQHYLYLEAADLVEINWRQLQFPVSRTKLLHDLEHELQLQLESDNEEPIPHLLRRHAPRVIGEKRAILWLHWELIAQHDKQQALTPAQLGEWLRFVSEFLGSRCPDDLRIICYLAIELESSKKYTDLEKIFQKQQRQPWCRRAEFRLHVLPPLGQVSENDLLYFLEDPANSSCDANIQIEIAERLIESTDGEFEAVVALMQEAENGSWYDLLAQLQREQGVEPLQDDDEPF